MNTATRSARAAGTGRPADPVEPLAQLFRDLRASPAGLSGREAARRLAASGPNELTRRGGRRWPGELVRQFTHPLAVLLAVAAVLAWASGTPRLGVAIVAVILLNAAFLPAGHARILRHRGTLTRPARCRGPVPVHRLGRG